MIIKDLAKELAYKSQPKWAIDEYLIILRHINWFIPLTPPTSAERTPNIKGIVLIFGETIIRRLKGPNFCSVINNKELFQESPSIVAGNQK